MQLLKSLVIGMAVVIVLGLSLLAYSLYRKAAEPDWTPFAGSSPEGADPDEVTPFGTLHLDLPAGCVIAGVRPDGDGAFAYVIIKPEGAKRGAAVGGPCNRVIIVDPWLGRVQGTIEGGRAP